MNAIAERPKSEMQIIVLERCEPARNMSRFYILSVQPTLFGDTALVREWGRIGTFGHRRLDVYPRQTDAYGALATWLARKQRKGYRLTSGQLETFSTS